MNTRYNTHYVITDLEEHNITRENFEGFLKRCFPEYRPHGMIKYPIDHIFLRAYDIVEDHNNLGRVILAYGNNKTELEVEGNHTDKLLEELKEKTRVDFRWIEQSRHFIKHNQIKSILYTLHA